MKDKRELLKTGVFGVTNRGHTFVVVGEYFVFQNGDWNPVASCDENLSMGIGVHKIQKLVQCNSFNQLQSTLDGSEEYPIIYDREKEPREIAVNNMLTLGISITYTNNFRRHGTVYLINGKTTTPINEDTHPALYQFIKSVESSRDAIVYAVFNEPNVHGQKTDIYVLLYLEKDAAENPQYKIHKENNLCKTITYNWCESTGIAEPALTYFQISDSGVWCLPNSIARVVAHHIDKD